MLSKRLLKARKQRGLTQAELAYLAQVKVNVISSLERGEGRMPSYDRFVRIALALGVAPEWLYPVSLPTQKAS